MSIIYEPSGKAREYAPLSCNLYSGCDHGCIYCYAPGIRRIKRADYLEVNPRRNVISEFEKDCRKYANSEKPVLFCFMTDPYNSLEPELRITREALKIAYRYKIPVQILTKSNRVTNDMDIIQKFGSHIQIGMTLTARKESTSKEWEPNASLPDERLATLRTFHDRGITTWASFEPVFEPKESLQMIEDSIDVVDIYKIGKINNFNDEDSKHDWEKFLMSAVKILRSFRKPFYVKHDLRMAAKNVKLYGNEVLMDEFFPPPFATQEELF